MRFPFHPGWLCIFAVAGLTACGVPGVPKPPSLNLPQPVTDLRAVRKGDRVYLAWTTPARTTDSLPAHQSGPTRVYRSKTAAMTDCGTPVAEVAAPEGPRKDRAVAGQRQSYFDTLPAALLSDPPASDIFYAICVLNENGRSAGLSNIVAVPGVVAPEPPVDFRALITSDGVVVNWTEAGGVLAGVRRFYRVYRRAEPAPTDIVAGEAPWGSTQFVDHNFEWEKNYSYRATVVTGVHREGGPDTEFESADTPVVKVLAHDVFPPAVPTGLQAVFSGVGQQPFIDLIWTPDTDADLGGYYVYRREAGSDAQKISAGVVTAPAFRDTNVTPGRAYFYSVSAVDVRGNESARSDEASESAP